MRSSPQPLVSKKRCVVYTRVSDDERLDQDYNSLEAQRDAGLAYIASQRQEGWTALQDRYEDGGFSGGSLERPALKRLLADVRAGLVDVIVVYKIDRLTRSMRDFFYLVDVFDEHGVSFVSVTQQFNTSNAMGRLVLNILLAFAQFEREQGAERIRDKIAASKAKGMWMGGVPPLGYDVRDRQLVVNEAEADVVRHIFRRFTDLKSITDLVHELNREGYTTKSWVTQEGKVREGGPIDKQYLYKLLSNVVYLGKIKHKKAVYDGLHEAIVPMPLWESVQAVLEEGSARTNRRATRNKSDVLLRGLLFGPAGERMVPTYTVKKGGKRYDYYYPMPDKKFGAGTSKLGAIPAREIEGLVLAQVFDVLRSPSMIQSTLDHLAEQSFEVDEAEAVLALRRMSAVWGQLFPEEQHRIVQLLIDRVQISDTGVEIKWRGEGWQRLVRELRPGTIGAELAEMETA